MFQSEMSFNNGSRWSSGRAVFILMKLNISLSPVGFIDLVEEKVELQTLEAADLGNQRII